MKILWIWNNNRDDASYHQENNGASFQKHDEYMRSFRLAHPKVETTGSKGISTADWFFLVPIQKVELVKCSQN